ncbi:alpha/beta hydrolase [Yoonia vestfoldensis]|uniref:Alpha/beta hydrolase n=1 Tax=Yoonia vestfoldensis SKA53 TaxID=314232 RepID=A3V1I9_9RHOB|nr:alpha/beta hydrolase [Yoonia vestfoldensis]EAQ07941.1 hypothetical protein SKA53_09464 [Yoonia vestfoldensis SKA53]
MKPLFDGDHLRATLYDRGHDKLIITFDFRSPGKRDFGKDQPSAAFARKGFAVLRVKTRRNDWFINSETAALEDSLRRIADDYDWINLLGYSMGGYAAFRFGSCIAANAIVAVSPQFSITPDIAPFDPRYWPDSTGFDPVIGDLASRLRPDQKGLILVDPFSKPDLMHAQLITAYAPCVRLARLAGGGHPATKVLAEAGQGQIIRTVATTFAPDPRPIITAHRAARAGSRQYLNRLTRARRQRGRE